MGIGLEMEASFVGTPNWQSLLKPHPYTVAVVVVVVVIVVQSAEIGRAHV